MTRSTKSIVALAVLICALMLESNGHGQNQNGPRRIPQDQEDAIVERVVNAIEARQELNDVLEQVKVLEERVAKLDTFVNELNTFKGKIAVKKDDKYYLVFDEMLTLGEFREQLVQISQAKLKLEGPESPKRRIVFINGTRWDVSPGKSYVWVPVGDVVVHFPDARPDDMTIQITRDDFQQLDWADEEQVLTIRSQRLNTALQKEVHVTTPSVETELTNSSNAE